MSETMVPTAAVLISDARQGFWMHEDGTLWKDNAPYVRADGVVPKASPRAHLAALNLILDAGFLDAAASVIEGRGTAWVEALGDPHWNVQLATARSRLTERRAYEITHGKGSAYNPNHPFSHVMKKHK